MVAARSQMPVHTACDVHVPPSAVKDAVFSERRTAPPAVSSNTRSRMTLPQPSCSRSVSAARDVVGFHGASASLP